MGCNECKRVIAFAGRIASGKGVANRILSRNWNAYEINYSDSLHEALRIMGIEEARDNIQRLSTFLRSTFGEDRIECAVIQKIKQVSVPHIALCGIRRESDFQYIKKLYPFTLIYIDSTVEQRYRRYIKRGCGTSDQSLTLDEFIIKDMAEPELKIEELKRVSDCIIENNCMLIEFEDAILRAISPHLVS